MALFAAGIQYLANLYKDAKFMSDGDHQLSQANDIQTVMDKALNRGRMKSCELKMCIEQRT